MTTIVKTASAVGYIRVSSPGQASERHVSLDVQASAFQDYCRFHNLDPIATFTDVASGRKDDRAEYRRMLAYVAQGGISHVVVLFLDRFGRNPREILRRYWELEERGITVQSINEDLQEELLLLIRAGIAGQESKRTSERVRGALRKAAEQGKLVSKIPFGFVKVSDRDGARIEQVPEEASVIRLAFEMSTVRNLGYKAIADQLNELGHRTKAGRYFSAQAIKGILQNPALIGRMIFRGDDGHGEAIVRDSVYPAILTMEEWEKLQQRLTIRREERHRGRTNSSQFLLSGILRCGYCGGPMAGNATGQRRYEYYVCVQNKKAAARCGERNPHRKADLESAILEHLGQYVDPDRVRALLESQGQEHDTRDDDELTRATTRLKALEQGFLNDLDRVDRGVMTEEQYLLRQQERDAEQTGLKTRKADLETSVAAQHDIEAQSAAVPIKLRSFLEDFRDMEVPQAKAVLQGIIKAAHVFNDGRIELEFRS